MSGFFSSKSRSLAQSKVDSSNKPLKSFLQESAFVTESQENNDQFDPTVKDFVLVHDYFDTHEKTKKEDTVEEPEELVDGTEGEKEQQTQMNFTQFKEAEPGMTVKNEIYSNHDSLDLRRQ